MRRLILLVVSLVVGCKGSGASSAPSGDVELETRSPSPSNGPSDFQVDDDVALIDDNGTFQVDGHVLAVASSMVRVFGREPRGMHGWEPGTVAKNPDGSAPTKGYHVRVGSGRATREQWLPAEHVFAVPWASAAHLAVGDTVYPRTFGDFKPAKCTVNEVPENVHQSVMVRCKGSDATKSVERKDALRSFEPATLGALHEGDVVYFDNMYWAIVVGARPPKVVIRESGFAAKDKVVEPSRLQIAR